MSGQQVQDLGDQRGVSGAKSRVALEQRPAPERAGTEAAGRRARRGRARAPAPVSWRRCRRGRPRRSLSAGAPVSPTVDSRSAKRRRRSAPALPLRPPDRPGRVSAWLGRPASRPSRARPRPSRRGLAAPARYRPAAPASPACAPAPCVATMCRVASPRSMPSAARQAVIAAVVSATREFQHGPCHVQHHRRSSVGRSAAGRARRGPATPPPRRAARARGSRCRARRRRSRRPTPSPPTRALAPARSPPWPAAPRSP